MHEHEDPSSDCNVDCPPEMETLTARFAVGHCENVVVFSVESGIINLAISMGTDNAEELMRQLGKTVAIIKQPSTKVLEIVK